jgi:TolA-binding protein
MFAGGDSERAIGRIDAYAQAYPGGALAAEASALRVEALVRAGRSQEATAELARLRAAYPGSPVLERLERLAGVRTQPPGQPQADPRQP